MRILKRILSCVMIVVFLFSSIKVKDVLGYEVFKMNKGNIEYIIEKDEVIIKKCVGDEEVSIPSEIDGKPVTQIGDFAFYFNAVTKSVIIPSSIRSI